MEGAADPQVRRNYQDAGKLVDQAMNFAINKAVASASLYEVCVAVDGEMTRLASSVPNSGIAFPCAISPNDIICHFSPTNKDPESKSAFLKTGDLIKIELGMHVQNCPAFACQSFIIGGGAGEEDVKTKLIKAAWKAAEATIKALKPGRDCLSITDELANIPGEFGANYTQGLMTHVISKNNLAGEKGIVYRPTADQRRSAQDHPAAVEANEVYLIDVVVSSGTHAVARPTAIRTSIFKKSGNVQSLRLKTSRQFLNDVSNRHGLMAFSMREFDEVDNRARIALKECLQAEVVHSYDVIADLEESAFTARFAFTAITKADGEAEVITNPKC
jgi:methionine aminopeptidase